MASITDVSLNWGLYYNLNNNGNDGIVTITTTDLDGSNVFITLDGNNSESVTISDNSANITISDASFSDLTSGTSYTINATIEGTDISNSESFTYETTRPSMTITATGVNSGDTTNDATLSLTFTSSKATTDFAVGDITVTNGSLSAFTKSSDTVYTATFTPIANGNCTIRVAENTFNDAAGNVNTASAQFTWVLDNTAPDYDVTEPIGNFIFNISIPIENRLIGNKSPTLVINTNEAGTLTTNIATGFNSGNSLSVSVGDNTIQLAELQYGTYSGKTLTLTDSANNSKTVTIPTFEVSAATLVVTSGIGIKRR